MSYTQVVRDYIKQNPNCTGIELYQQGLVGSERTGRRYIQYYKEDRAPEFQQRVRSEAFEQHLEAVEEELTLDELFELIPRLISEYEKDDPVFYVDRLNFSDCDYPIAITFPSCAHLGSRYTAYPEFKEFFNKILKIDNIYWASLGDDIEGFLPGFRDADAVASQLPLRLQWRLIEHVLDELSKANKLLLGMSSQHGDQWEVRNSASSHLKQFYLDHRVPFFDGKAYVKLQVGDQTYNIAMAHEFPGHSMWNPLHPQKKAMHMDFPNADVLVMGDKHQAAFMDVPAFNWEYQAGNRASDRALLIQSGTAKTGADKYTIRGWSMGQFEWPTLVFYPDRHLIKYSWYLDDIEMWLEEW